MVGQTGFAVGANRAFIRRIRNTAAAGLAALAMAVAPAAARGLKAPSGKVVLTVGGAIERTNRGAQAVFDRAMLNRLGKRTLRTGTSWTKGVQTFEGVLARDLIETVGAKGKIVRATALNDYTITIPLSDFREYDVLLATKMNGKTLTRRDKGPIWIVYPRDRHPELQNQKVDAKWIWQLVRLQVE